MNQDDLGAAAAMLDNLLAKVEQGDLFSPPGLVTRLEGALLAVRCQEGVKVGRAEPD